MTQDPTGITGKDRYPSYRLRDYPVGVDAFIETFPPHRREEIQRAILQLNLKDIADKRRIDRTMQEMVELPEILYKYVPYERLDDGFPKTLRATQPAALNDVMEGNVSTSMENKMDRDEWWTIISRSLRDTFGEDTLSDEELERRKRLYGDPKVSTIIRERLSQSVGVVSLSADPLIATMWAHYAHNSGFVVGYKTNMLRDFGIDLRRVLYLELAPVYMPTRDNVIRIRFVDEERRQQDTEAGRRRSGTPLISHDVELLELTNDAQQLAKLLFVKGLAWEYEQEVRLLVDLQRTSRPAPHDDPPWPIHTLEIPMEAVEEVYVGFDTPTEQVKRISRIVDVGHGTWRLKHTHWHAYRLQVTSTSVYQRKPPPSNRELAHLD